MAAWTAAPLALALGAIVGLILALAGAGGGILAVPLLVFGLHLSISQAAPVGLIAVGLAAGVGAVIGLREGLVRYRAAAVIGGTGLLLAPAGVWLAQRLPDTPLAIAFSLVLAWVSWRMGQQAAAAGPGADVQPASAPPCRIDGSRGRLIWTRPCAGTLAATGVIAGTLTGLLGVGGGFVIVPALRRYTDLGMRSVQATSLAVIALASVGGIGAAAAHGAIEGRVALPFAVGAVLALLVGRRLARRLSGARLQQAFAGVTGGVALLLAARALGLLG